MYLATAILNELNNPDLTFTERARLRCRLARQYEQAGEYEAASEAMAESWHGVGARPTLEGLDEETKALVLLRVGALSGWIGSVRQIEGSQEMAKDLISESLRIFEQLKKRSKVGESHSELALCYWRAGAHDEARITLQEALDEFDEGDIELKAIALLRKAHIERASNRLNEALRIYENSTFLFDKINNHLLAGTFHHGYANVLNQLSAIEDRKDYIDLALIEYAVASFNFERAGHERYHACVENNLGFLLGTIGNYVKAHEHLDRAQMLMTRLKDNVHLAQVDETRARVFLAEERIIDAEKIARVAVRKLEKGDELSLLAEALTTHGIALARLDHFDQARATLERAIEVAEQAGDFEKAGVAALTLIERLDINLSSAEVWTTAIDRLNTLLEKTTDISVVKRITKSAFRALFLTHTSTTPPDWTNFSFRQAVLQYESHLIALALNECKGSVTKASRLLGFRHHQSLIVLIENRHKELLPLRTPIRKRLKHLMTHPKRKQKNK